MRKKREEEEMGAEDEGLKGAAVDFFWKMAAEIISAINFLFIGLEERGSPKKRVTKKRAAI